jgi:hypothetical protein
MTTSGSLGGMPHERAHLAALHDGLYHQAVNALYALEVRSLGRWEAEARHQLDLGQITETRRRDTEADD